VQFKCHNVLMYNLLTFDVFYKFIWRQAFVSFEHKLLQFKYLCTDCYFCLPSSRPKTTLHQWNKELTIIWNPYVSLTKPCQWEWDIKIHKSSFLSHIRRARLFPLQFTKSSNTFNSSSSNDPRIQPSQSHSMG
jgi:hypothetical protein